MLSSVLPFLQGKIKVKLSEAAALPHTARVPGTSTTAAKFIHSSPMISYPLWKYMGQDYCPSTAQRDLMDPDLLSDPLGDHPDSSLGTLLPNLPRRRLTNENSNVDPSYDATHSYQTALAITKIENIFEAITDCIRDEKKELSIPLKSRAKRKARKASTSTATKMQLSKTNVISFPSKSRQEAWKFSGFLGNLRQPCAY